MSTEGRTHFIAPSDKFSGRIALDGEDYAKGGEVGEDEDGNKYEILWGDSKPFKSGDMAYNPMSGSVMEVYFDENDADADDEYYVQETYARVKKLNKGGFTDMNIAYVQVLQRNIDDYAKVENILKKHNIEINNSKEWHTKGYAEELWGKRDDTGEEVYGRHLQFF